VTVVHLMLYGNGRTQRLRSLQGMEDHVRSQISQVGTDTTGELAVVDGAVAAGTTTPLGNTPNQTPARDTRIEP
jgi:hypothetical protein